MDQTVPSGAPATTKGDGERRVEIGKMTERT
jgi:hypothetical protein